MVGPGLVVVYTTVAEEEELGVRSQFLASFRLDWWVY